MKVFYLPKSETEKLLWIKNFSSKVNNYAAKYAINAAEVTDMVQSAVYLNWVMDCNNLVTETSRKWTKYKNELIKGINAGSAPSTVPVNPTLSAIPAVVAPDIFGRATALVSRIKAHKDYTQADGLDLGIEGAEIVKDMKNIKPNLAINLNAGHPEINWKKNTMTSLEVWVDRGTGEYVFMTIATKKLIPDLHPLPTQNTAQLWKYKAIYRYQDTQVGQWSDEISVKV